MNNQMASHGVALRVVDPTRLPFPSKVAALHGSSSQISPLALQSYSVKTYRRERIGVVIEMTVPTMTRPRASPANLPEISANAGSICSPEEAGYSMLTFP